MPLFNYIIKNIIKSTKKIKICWPSQDHIKCDSLFMMYMKVVVHTFACDF